jgi:pyruvate decarboxylase
VHDLVAASQLPTFVAPMDKGAVDKTHRNYGGVYAGDRFNEAVRERVESSGLILNIEAIKSDFNTAGFTYRIGQLHAIDFYSNLIRVKYPEDPNISMENVLRKVI